MVHEGCGWRDDLQFDLLLFVQLFFQCKVGSKQGGSFCNFLYQGRVFFIKGLTMASLKASGIIFSERDLLTILWMVGKSTGSTVFTREVGIGSRPQDFELLWEMIFKVSFSEIGEKDFSCGQFTLF